MTSLPKRGLLRLLLGMVALAWTGALTYGQGPPGMTPYQLPPPAAPAAPPSLPIRNDLPPAGGSAADEENSLVAEVRVVGNDAISANKVRSFLKTREGRYFDPEQVQRDVGTLNKCGLFRNVRTYKEATPAGMIVTFEVFERPTMRYIKYVGNRSLSEATLKKKSELKVGEALNAYTVEEARRKLEDYYHTKGFAKARVSVIEGNQPQDRGVVLLINEGQLQRIWDVDFIGNTVASDERLKTQIQSKPGYFKYLFGGTVDRTKIDEDVERLTAYYRGLGYFRARIGRELRFHEDGKWLYLTFVVDEGPRYVVRNISFMGNNQFGETELFEEVELKASEYFDQAKMNADVRRLRDRYGGLGYMFADIQAEPRFLEEPGELDLVYQIDEGKQYRVGEIFVKIEGPNPHTRRSVIMNRLSFRPGDLLDSREIRDSERRLVSSQLFRHEPSRGISPKIVVKPPEEALNEELAGKSSGPGFRGQSPDPPPARYPPAVAPSGQLPAAPHNAPPSVYSPPPRQPAPQYDAPKLPPSEWRTPAPVPARPAVNSGQPAAQPAVAPHHAWQTPVQQTPNPAVSRGAYSASPTSWRTR